MKSSFFLIIAILMSLNAFGERTGTMVHPTVKLRATFQREYQMKPMQKFVIRKRSRYTSLEGNDTDSIRLTLRKKEEKWYC